MTTFIVEDGTGLTNSTSYATVSEISDYLDRYKTASTSPTWFDLTETNQERIAIRGTLGIDNKFRTLWKGSKSNYDQARDWPRSNVYDASGQFVDWDSIPQLLKNCLGEYCKELADGNDPLENLDRGGEIASESVQGAVSVSYFGSATPGTQYRLIESMLSDFLFNSDRLIRG